MPECVTCTRPTDVALCPGCVDQLAGELRQIPWLVDQLTITLTRQARIGDRNGPRPTEHPLVYDHRASVDLETLRDGLAHWAAAVAEQRHITVDATHQPKPLALWLLRWIGAAAQHTQAAELHADILAMTRAARRTIDLAPALRFVGPCEDCGQDLYVGMHAHTVTCNTEGCDAEYPLAERRVWLLEQAYDRLLTAAEMSRAIRELVPGQEVNPNRISQWAARGRLIKYLPHPRDPHLRPRFRVEDIIQLARAESERRIG